MTLQDILAAFSVILNGLPAGLYALTFGFAAVPTAIGFAIGAIGCGLLGLVSPISFQAETITLAGTLGNTPQERFSIIFLEGFILLIIGLLGFFQALVTFIGPVITSGMMAGVGIILARVAVDMVIRRPVVGFVSVATALAAYYMTPNPADKLVYTIVISVLAASLAGCFFTGSQPTLSDKNKESFVLQKFIFNRRVIRGALAICALNIGANIAFGSITAKTLAQSDINLDHLTIVSSLADMGSSLFGGGPVQAIISATGAAPHPVASGVLMMSLMAIILVSGMLPKLGRYVSGESISGFLLVLGVIVTVPTNAGFALAGGIGSSSAIVGGVTMAMTAITDPFIGMLGGLCVQFLMTLFPV
ncbi:MAG: hypothetical protein E6713_12965 [Sporomusaceae bacterium]|nr:hypothetical protein [Sporomusaceae bacterium]